MDKQGFTLVELMLVVVLIAILASIALPNTSRLIRQSREARTLANLAMLRGAIAMYYTDHEGRYPTDNLDSLTLNGRYLRSIPIKDTPPYHPAGNTVSVGSAAQQTGSFGDWFYINDPFDPHFGQVQVNCIHTNIKGKTWTAY